MSMGETVPDAAGTPSARRRVQPPPARDSDAFKTAGRPFQWRDAERRLTFQWFRAGNHWRLSRSGRTAADVVPDERWPCMYRVVLPGRPLLDMVNLTRARDAAVALAGRAEASSGTGRVREIGTRGDASWPRSGGYETTVAVERGNLLKEHHE
jgi:hypothetical protein